MFCRCFNGDGVVNELCGNALLCYQILVCGGKSCFGDEFKKSTMALLRRQVFKEQSLVSCDLCSFVCCF
jgi:diaminopimelate epimerase